METVIYIYITDKKQIASTFIQIVSFTCQRLTKIINIVVFVVSIAFCTKFSPVSVQVTTFTRLALLISSGGDWFKSRLEHRQFWLKVFIVFLSTSKKILEKQLR